MTFLQQSLYLGFVISILAYLCGVWLKKKLGWAILNPLLVSVVLVIGFLTVFGIDYKTYNSSASVISYLLTPATVCLAIPLYKQLELLKKHFAAILTAIISGVFTSAASIFAMSLVFRLDHGTYASLLPKSITTAIGMGISEEVGGMVTVTVVCIIATGIFGNIIGETVFRILGIQDPMAKQEMFLAAGQENYFIGTVEAEPALEEVLAQVKKGSYKRAVLQPLMIVAGDHANNDMAGEEEGSWKQAFEEAGYEVSCILRGLGELEKIRQLFVKHAKEAESCLLAV